MDIKDKNKEKHLNELMVGVRERIGKHRDSLAELADEVIQLQVEEMSAKANVLAQIAGGAEKGALWHAEFDAKKTTILEHFRVTLDKIKGQQVDSARDATQKAHDEVLKMDGTYSRLCERSFLEKGTRSSALTSARHIIVRAYTTKAEVLLCKTIERGGSKMGGRCQQFTSEFSHDTKENWEQWVQEDLVKLVKASSMGGA